MGNDVRWTMASIVSIEGFLKLGTISTNEQKNEKKEKKYTPLFSIFNDAGVAPYGIGFLPYVNLLFPRTAKC